MINSAKIREKRTRTRIRKSERLNCIRTRMTIAAIWVWGAEMGRGRQKWQSLSDPFSECDEVEDLQFYALSYLLSQVVRKIEQPISENIPKKSNILAYEIFTEDNTEKMCDSVILRISAETHQAAHPGEECAAAKP